MKPKTQYMTIALAAVLSFVAVQPCAAVTRTVTNALDDGSGGTLREALASALDGDTIEFALTTPATIYLASGALVVDKSVTITGPGDDQLTVDGQHLSGVFYVVPPDPEWTMARPSPSLA